MNEPTMKCIDCDANILQRTAERRGGRCVRCHHRAKSIPPEGSGKLRELYDRLVAVDMNPVPVMRNTWLHDDKMFLQQLEDAERSKRVYLEWAPRLRLFAQECRRALPIPLESECSAPDLGKQRVFETVLTQPRSVKYRVTICCMPVLAMAVAQRLWSTPHPDIVYLTKEERDRWFDKYSGKGHGFNWCSLYSIDLEDPAVPEVRSSKGKDLLMWNANELREGEQAWLVSTGETLGPMCGQGHSHLWAWDGVHARHIKRVSEWVS